MSSKKAGSSSPRTYRGVPAEERRAHRRERLLAAGLELLGTEGWQATTVTAVCDRARLTARYFYESFRDRDELLVAIFDRIVEEVAEEARRALPAAPPDIRATLRATISAWVKVAAEDPRKAHVTFVEALGSEALMRRRLDTMRRFADFLSQQAAATYEVHPRDRSALDLAGLVVAGGLIETMIEWVEGRIERSPGEVIEDYTLVCAASFEAAATPALRRRSSRPT